MVLFKCKKQLSIRHIGNRGGIHMGKTTKDEISPQPTIRVLVAYPYETGFKMGIGFIFFSLLVLLAFGFFAMIITLPGRA